MIRNTTGGALIFAAGLLALPTAGAQSIDTPQTRLRPIGAASMVDQYLSSPERTEYRDTVARQDHNLDPQHDSSVQQAAWMQTGEAPLLPNSGGMALPDAFSPAPIPFPSAATPPPPSMPPGVPRGLPFNPGAAPTAPVPGSAGQLVPAPGNPLANNDYAPLNQPRLDDRFATLGNSCHVSGPSSYTAASASGCCAPVNYQAPPAYIAPPAPIAPPPMTITGAPVGTVLPATPIATVPRAAPAGSLLSFGQDRYPVQVGQGLFGQPVAYVPGQKCRNWIRYFFP